MSTEEHKKVARLSAALKEATYTIKEIRRHSYGVMKKDGGLWAEEVNRLATAFLSKQEGPRCDCCGVEFGDEWPAGITMHDAVLCVTCWNKTGGLFTKTERLPR